MNTQAVLTFPRPNPIPRRSCSLLAAVLAASLCAGIQTQAGTKTWNATGADGNWGTTANWDVLAAPVSGDNIIFPSGTLKLLTTNNLSNLQLNGIMFGGSSYLLSGSMLTNGANGLTNLAGAGNNTNNIILNLSAPQTVENDGAILTLGGALTNLGNDLTITGSGGNVNLNGVIGGNTGASTNTGGLIVNMSGSGVVRLGAANTFVGGVNIQSGTVQLGNAGGVPSGAGRGDLTIGSGATFDINNNSPGINGLSGSGTLQTTASVSSDTTFTLTIGNDASNNPTTFSGSIGEAGTGGALARIALTKVNTNKMTLNGIANYTGATTINGGTLALGASGSLSTPIITVAPGGVFDVSAQSSYDSGTKTLSAGQTTNGGPADIIGNLQTGTSSGILYPRQIGPGTLTISGNLNLYGGGTVVFDLSTNTAVGGGTNDLIVMNGTLSFGTLFGNTIISLNPIFGSFATGTPYTLISNLNGSAISGSLSSLSAIVGRGQSPSFSGSSGNLLLTINGTASPASLVWAPSSADNNWDTGVDKSWNNGGNPDEFQPFDNVTFSDNASNTTVNLVSGVSPGSMNFNNSLSNYTVSGAGSIGGFSALTKSGAANLSISVPTGFSGNINVNGGALALLDYTSSGNNVLGYNGVTPGTTAMGGGGIFVGDVASFASVAELGILALNPGGGSIGEQNRASSSAYQVHITNVVRNVGGTVDFAHIQTKASSPQVGVMITNTTTVNGILGGWATWGESDWVVPAASGAGSFNYSAYQTATTPTSWGATSNINLSANPSASLNNTSINSLRLTNGASVTINSGQTLTLASGGILVPVAATAASSIIGGSLAGSAGGDLVVNEHSSSANLTIGSTIVDNSSKTALTKTGTGTLILTANNIYTGPTYISGPIVSGGSSSISIISAGTLQVGNGGTTGSLGSSGAVTNYGTLAYNRSDAITDSDTLAGLGSFKVVAGDVTLTGLNTMSGPVIISAGTLRVGSGGTAGSISSASSVINNGSLFFNRSDSISYAGVISGTGSLTKQGAGTLTLGTAETYLGNTTVSAGTLALGASASILNSPVITVASGASLDASAAGGLALNGSVNQALVARTVIGSITAITNTSVQPAGNGTVGTLNVTGDLSLTGGTLSFDLTPGTRDQINVNNLTLTEGLIQLSVTGGSLPNGTYKLIGYSGTLSGGAANLAVSGFSQPGQIAQLSDATAGEIDLVVSSYVAQDLVWDGMAGSVWDINTTTNWLKSGAPAFFHNFDNTTFDDTAASFGVSIPGTVSPATVTVNAVNNYTFSGAGAISDGATLTKNNTGTLYVQTPNDYAGLTTINAGAVEVDQGAKLSAGNVSLGASGTLVFNQGTDNPIVSGTLSGSGMVIQEGTGTMTISGNNTLSGIISNASATLQVGDGALNGSLGTATVLNNGTLFFNRSGTVTQSGAISGSGSVVNNGSATLVLSSTANSYTGNTVVTNGTLQLGASEVIPNGTGTGNVQVDFGATLDLNGHDETIGGLASITTSSSLSAVLNSSVGSSNILTVGDNNANTVFYGQIHDNNGTGGTVTLRKMGTGELRFNNTLSGALNYTGPTLVGGGQLTFGNGVNGNGNIILSNATTLRLQGTSTANGVGGTLSVASGASATVASAALACGVSGNIVGDATTTLTLSGGQSINSGSVLQFQNFLGVVTNPASTELRFPSGNISNGGSNTIFDVEGTVDSKNGTGSGLGIVLGKLVGAGTLSGADATGTESTTRFVIGTANASSTFTGTIQDSGNANTAITKAGTGILTLNGTLSFTGPTTVSGGTLALGGSATLANSATIAVGAGGTLDMTAVGGVLNLGGQTLTGSGTLTGSLIATNSASSVNPGDSTGTLTVSGSAVVSNAMTMQLNVTNASPNSKLVAPSINLATATINVTNVGPGVTNGTVFQLFSPTPIGTPTAVNLPNPGVYVWQNHITTDGTIKLLNGGLPISTTPVTMSAVFSGGALKLSWPADHTGYYLLTNAVGLTNPAAWNTWPLSQTTNQILITPSSTAFNVFFRLVNTNQ